MTKRIVVETKSQSGGTWKMGALWEEELTTVSLTINSLRPQPIPKTNNRPLAAIDAALNSALELLNQTLPPD